MALPANLFIDVQFDLRAFASEVINITDNTDYVAEGVTPANVKGYLKIQSPSGVLFYDNWDGVVPDIDMSLSPDSPSIPMYKNNAYDILRGNYRFYYRATDGVDTWEKTFDLDFTYEQPDSGFVMTLDGYASTGRVEDLTDYTGLTVLSRVNTFIYPTGSGEPDIITSDPLILIDPLWAGINTATLIVQLEYDEVSGIHVLDTINSALMEWAFNVNNYNVMQMAEDFTEEFQGHLGENISAADIQRADVNVMSSYLGLYELALVEKNSLKCYEYAVEILMITSRNGITPLVEIIPEFIFPGGGGVSPLTTKGDIYTYTSQDARIAVGLDGQILSANSAFSTGLEWINPPSGGGGVTDHGELTGLDDDDHPQYALLTGRLGDIYAVDTINEFSSGAGVYIEGVHHIDGDVGIVGGHRIYFDTAKTTSIGQPFDFVKVMEFRIDGGYAMTISETEVVLFQTIKGYSAQFDVINENTGNSGVTVDGVENKDGSIYINHVNFNTSYTNPAPAAGDVWWNDTFKTLNIATGLTPIQQVGEEIYIIIYNDTGTQINNSTVLRPKAATLVGSEIIPTVDLADASVFSGAEGTLMVATMDIPNGTIGVATRFGRLSDANTSAFNPGDSLFLSATTPGLLTNVKPDFPNYDLSIGGVLKIGTTDGEIIVSVTRDIFHTTKNFFNGTFRESIDFLVSSNGSTVTGTLTPQGTNLDMTCIFSDGLYMLDTSPSATIALTPGTDTAPISNFVYIPRSTKVLTVSTSDWPSEEHIKVATIVLKSALATQTEGALRNQNWNDHLQGTNGQGHLSHITERMRQENSMWENGTEGSMTVVAGTPEDLYVSVTSGIVYQMHRQSFPAIDTQTTGDVNVVNHSSTPYLSIQNLNTQILDANGVTLNDGSFSFVLWGVANKSGQPSHLMLNLPTGKYAFGSPDDAVSDPLNYSVYTIPKIFKGVGFLIARFTMTYKLNAWVLYETEDLRGRVPSAVAGGGSGGSGAASFLALLDTPGSYIGNESRIVASNAGGSALEFTDSVYVTTISEAVTSSGITLAHQTYMSVLEEADADDTMYYNSSTGKVTFGDTLIRSGSYLDIPVTVTTPSELIIGDITEDTAVEIHYTLQRGSIMRKGVVEVMNINGVNDPLVHDESFGTAEAGVEFDSSLSTNNIVLEITVDNSSTNTVDMYYTSIKIKGTVDSASPEPPAAPTGVVGVNYNVQTYLIWSANSEPTLLGYNIYRSTISGTGYTKVNTSLIPAGTEEFWDTTVVGNISYYYVITAVTDSPQESPYSSEEYINRLSSLTGFSASSRFAYADVGTDPKVMVVDRLTASYLDGAADGTGGVDYRGSLAYCLRQSFPRIIYFEVSGTIDMRTTQYLLLDADFDSTVGYCWVVGQSAPSPGINITGTTLWIDKVSDALFQHITIEMGDRSTTISNANDKDSVTLITLPPTSDRIMFDRCTSRWGTDETFSGSANEMDVSRCLIYESLAHHETAKKEDSFHPSLSVFYNSTAMYRTILAYGYDRCPWLWPSTADDRFAILNNVFYNTYRTGVMIGNPLDAIRTDIVIKGNWVYRFRDEVYDVDEYTGLMRNDGTWNTSSKIYMDDNLSKRREDGFTEWESLYQSSIHTPGNESSSPFDISGFNVLPASETKDSVLAEGGSMWRDAHDQRIINGIDADIINDRTWYMDSPQALPARAVNWMSNDGQFPTGTSTLISFSGDVITEATGQFDHSDITIGSTITVSGSVSNDGIYTVTGIGSSPDTITCAGAGFTTEAAGASITLTAGWDWSAASQGFTIEVNGGGGTAVTLNASCVGTAGIVSHINTRLAAAGVSGVEAYAVWDYPAGTGGVGIRTTSTGADQEIIITNSTLTGIDLQNGTYTGQDAISGGYLTRENNSHTFTFPANPHDVWGDGIITNLEKWTIDTFNTDPVNIGSVSPPLLNPNLAPNGGGDDTTDWIDTDTNGVADSWQVGATGTYSASIVTGNGFIGNAQRLVYTDIPGSYAFLACSLSGLTIGLDYDIDFLARGSVNVRCLMDGAVTVATATATSGNPNLASGRFTATATSHIIRFYFTPTSPGTGDWMEVDEVNFRESLPNLVSNGGGYQETDWTDTNTDGVADDWLIRVGGYGTASIVTGNGFTGNAQRIQIDVTDEWQVLYQLGVFTAGETYEISLKYRSNSAIKLYQSSSYTIASLPSTSGVATDFSTEYLAVAHAEEDRFLIYFDPTTTPVAGSYFEVDEITIRRKV